MAYILDDSLGAVGEFKHSNMTVAQFQAQWGPNWVLANGQSIAGSTLAAIQTANSIASPTLAPNAMGLFLRGAGSQTVGGVSLSATFGATQGDQMQSHWHNLRNNSGGLVGIFNDSTSGGGTGILGSNGAADSSQARDLVTDANSSTGTPRAGSETRPANLAVNIFVRIN